MLLRGRGTVRGWFQLAPTASGATSKCGWSGSFLYTAHQKLVRCPPGCEEKPASLLCEQSELQGELLVRTTFPQNSVNF